MKYLGNDRNIVRDATLTATNIVASNVVYRTDDDEKKGGGQVALTGDYTGASDATIDIKIVDTTITGTPKVSAPIFSGVGNGTMAAISADSGTAAQQIIVALEDMGTVTAKAYAPFQGVTLRAKSSGTAGNAISVSVDNSGLTFTDTAFSLQHDMSAGTNEYVGDEWNFGAAILNPDLTLPDSAPRVSFGADPQVYRQFKFYRDGHYVFAFSPSPVRDVPRGTVVKAVTGTHSVTVSNGGTTDTVSGVVSLYDALAGIRDHSSLVDVVGAIVNDKTGGGQAAVELSVWTVAYVTGLIADGSDAIRNSELVVIPAATAPTETLQIVCIDGTTTGAEKWQVRGDVSGRLSDAITGALYADGAYTFTIPLPIAGAASTPGVMTVAFELNGDRESPPDLCAILPLIGAAGRAGTWEFVWQTRTATCSPCTDGEYQGSPNYTCLGIDPPGGTSVSDESRLIRLQRLTTAVRGFIADNTASYPTAGVTDALDVDWFNKTAAILQKGLESIASATPLAVWQTGHVYTLDNMRESVNRNGYRFAVTTAGTSGGSEPTWVTTIGSTTTDSGVTWTCIGKTPYAMWDDLFAQFIAESSALLSTPGAATAWAGSTGFTAHTIGRPTTANRNGHLYYSHGIGTSGGSEPTWPTTPRAAVQDGDGYWVEFLNYWNASHVMKAGAEATPGDGFVWVAQADGTTGSTEPNWFTAGNTVSDGGVTWVRKAQAVLAASLSDEYFQRWQSAVNDILAAAGIDPTFKSASTDGDGCWQDYGGDGWFVFDGTDVYLPLFAGRYNYSAKKTFKNGIEVDESTQEWGVGLKFCNTENLAPGDRIRITIIGDALGGQGYQAGDSYAATITHSEAIPLGGGQAGNDTLTFHVTGSAIGTLPKYYLLHGDPPAARANSHAYVLGDRYVPAVANGRFYECTQAGTSAAAPPVFTTNRTEFTDGTAKFTDMGGVASYAESGIAFDITPGGIAFGLGDSFTFNVEGGHFEWRIDGGSWSSATVIADTVSLSDGLSATFTGGTAPSWVPNDQWSFAAEAVNGVDNIKQPLDERLRWTGSTAITVDPGASDAIAGVLLCDHDIPSDAVITLLGSDDDFVTAPLTQAIAWQERHIYAVATATHAKYRVTIDKGGSLNWLHLGAAFEPTLPNGIVELGTGFTKRIRLPGLAQRRAFSATITHAAMSQASADGFDDMFEHAGQYDDGRIAIVPNEAEPGEIGLVQFDGPLEFTDARDFQPRSTAGKNRLISTTLTLNPIA